MASEAKESTVYNKKVLLVGGRGTIGSRIITAFDGLQIYGYDSIKLDITIGGSSDQGKEVTINDIKYPYIQINLTKSDTIKAALDIKDKYDWCIICGGGAPMGPFTAHTVDSFKENFNSKGFGQIDFVMQCNKYLNDNGCVVLTTGYLDSNCVKGTSGLAAVNGMLNSFVKTASLEMGRGIKLNSVSPGLLTESAKGYGPFLPGEPSVDGKDVARAFVSALIGGKTGRVFEITSPVAWITKSG